MGSTGSMGSGDADEDEDDEGARLFASMQAGVDMYSAGLQMGMSEAVRLFPSQFYSVMAACV